MPEVNPSDAELAIRCQLGEAEAWEAPVRRWHGRLWRFLSRMLPDQSVDDVLQNVWLRVVRSLVRLREPERLAGWLFGVARAAAADRLREQYRRAPTGELGEVVEAEPTRDLLAAGESVEAALAALHPVDREAVVLFYLEELPVADVAEICKVPEGTVKSRLHRARRMIREALTIEGQITK